MLLVVTIATWTGLCMGWALGKALLALSPWTSSWAWRLHIVSVPISKQRTGEVESCAPTKSVKGRAWPQPRSVHYPNSHPELLRCARSPSLCFFSCILRNRSLEFSSRANSAVILCSSFLYVTLGMLLCWFSQTLWASHFSFFLFIISWEKDWCICKIRSKTHHCLRRIPDPVHAGLSIL